MRLIRLIDLVALKNDDMGSEDDIGLNRSTESYVAADAVKG